MIFLIGMLALLFAAGTYGFLEAAKAGQDGDGEPDYWSAITWLSVMGSVGLVLLLLVALSL